jgi:hypothetical protein
LTSKLTRRIPAKRMMRRTSHGAHARIRFMRSGAEARGERG